MTLDQTIGFSLAMLVMLAGLIGSVIPAIPSTPLVFAAALGHRLYFGEAGADIWVMVMLGVLMALSLVLDQIASMVGAKKLGATWKGITGAVIGGVAGLFFPMPGIIIGPFLGALVFEALGGRNFKESTRAGIGATLGLLVGAVAKLGCCVGMIALFAWNILSRFRL